MAEVDRLESDGFRVELYMAIRSVCWTLDGMEQRLRIKMKSPDDPLSIESVSAVMAPWFLRRWVLGWWTCEVSRIGKKCSFGYGHPRDYPVPEGARVI